MSSPTDAPSPAELRRRLEEHRREVEALEARLRELGAAEPRREWFPGGFYTAYHVLAGMVLGLIASWVTLILNYAGALAAGLDDPLRILRVYATIIGGEGTAGSRDAVVLAFATGLHTVTGIICGTPIHLVYSRFFARAGLLGRLLSGLWLGAVMWIVNFYGILSWLQPLLTGEESSTIVRAIPWWVALATHVAFTEVMLALGPLGVFHRGHHDPRAAAGDPG